jgi:arsenate reductase-like glutaredoxin family protein
VDEARAIELMLQHPTLIRRPILDVDGRYLCGFNPEQYESFLPD